MLRLLLIFVMLAIPATATQTPINTPRIVVSYNSCSNPITLKQKRKKIYLISLKNPYIRFMAIENDFFACSLIA